MEKKYFVISGIIIVIVLFALVAYLGTLLPVPQFPSFSNNDSSFSVVVLPDIQDYSFGGNSGVLFAQMNWIAENKDKNNLKFVIFEGDLVNNWNNPSQWNDVNKAVSILERGGVPFELTLGNHDHNAGDFRNNAPLFDKFFPESRLSAGGTWGGSFEKYNTYQELALGDGKFLFLSLDVCPSKEEVAWADGVFSQNEGKQLVLTIHGYLGTNDTLNVHVCGNTEYIWEMAKKHKNLRIILSGHEHGEATLVSKNDFGNNVYQLLSDYQDFPKGGNGYFRILTFVPKESKLIVRTYSPYLDKFKTDSNSAMEFVYALN